MKLLDNTKFLKNLNKQEVILYSQEVKKYSPLGYKQTRILLITDQYLYNIDKTKIKRKIELKKIVGLSISKQSSEFLFHISSEYDYMFFSDEYRDDIIMNFLNIYCEILKIEDDLKLFIHDDKSIQKYQNKQSQTVLPTINYQLVDKQKWIQYLSMVNQSNNLPQQTSQFKLLYSKNKKIKTSEISPKNFEILRIIGKGTVSKIYLVEKKNSMNPYVLKKISISKLKSLGDFDFEQTNKKIENYQHQTFLEQLQYSFVSDKNYYFFLPFYKNGDLFEFLKKHKNLEENKAKLVFAQMALALGMLHEKGQQYMDLKPENILIDDNGQLILTDFGINRYFFNKCSENLIGTKEYLSPELIAGGNHSRNSDWWCLGMLLYEMLMTVPAFLHPDENQMFFMISVARPYFPQPCIFSEDCQNIIIQLLHKNPDKRLGANYDLEDIKQHSWFKEFNWEFKTKNLIIDWIINQDHQYHDQFNKIEDLVQSFDPIFIRQNTLDFVYE